LVGIIKENEMTDKEILQKAIEKAKQNGYIGRPDSNETIDDLLYDCDIFTVIFAHDFVKAFWGEELVQGLETNSMTEELIDVPCWQLHLREMVLEENPIKYLEKFL